MKKYAFKAAKTRFDDNKKEVSESLLPHKHQTRPIKPGFVVKGHNGDTQLSNNSYLAVKKMRPPSEPEINRDDPKKYFIYWNQDVPAPLWAHYPRKRMRFKVYDDINRYSGEEREEYAEFRRKVWKYKLEVLKYSPFDEDLAKLNEIGERTAVAKEKIKKKSLITEEEARRLTPVKDAFKLFIQSRTERKIDIKSVTTYQNTVNWLSEHFESLGIIDGPISEIKHIQIKAALNAAAKKREWSATTINKEIEFSMTIFNWFEAEEYMVKNPSRSRIAKLPTQKSKHRWYDRKTAVIVRDAIIKADKIPLLRACQFTYFLLIRSKTELRKLTIGDIDRELGRVRYSAELSKTNIENYRDYPPEFNMILDQMNLEQYPPHYFVFGKHGLPGTVACSHNYFSKLFKPIKDDLELSDDYTIYGWKHTRIVHEMMKGKDGYYISHLCRHTTSQSTEDYKRDYDITLVNVYGPDEFNVLLV
jgi:hypothetical protein